MARVANEIYSTKLDNDNKAALLLVAVKQS